MGKWGSGPFENDTGADFAGDLADAPEAGRFALLLGALTGVVECEGHIDAGRAERGLAAAALVSCRLEGSEEFRFRHFDCLAVVPSAADGLVKLAAEAVERLLTGDNDVIDDWAQEGNVGAWTGSLRRLRAALTNEGVADQGSLW